MSAETIMAGLYPPVGDEIWNEKIHWRPTPVHSEPLFIDHSVGRGAYCQKYNQDLAKVNSGRYLRTHNKEDKDLLKYLSKYTGDIFANINQIPELFDILTVEKNHNLVLPNWTHAVYPDALAKVVLELSIMRTKNPELTKLSIGPLLNKILLQFQYVSKNKKVIGKMDGDKRKFEIYVGNSTLIYDSLHALKVAPVGVVPFGAALIFELWNSPENNYVKVLYRPSPQINNNLQQLKINPCKSLRCPYDIFTSTLKNISVNDIEWEHLCQQ
ncbi:hypothetical protein HHI36_021158 [Cryptolaemus montrouzieri]|uniref:acid phosphatase n=1 Tax=Cryptolaemus montrouzieri TaxID=559131 RepID=A0ABD2MW26_9CUCU